MVPWKKVLGRALIGAVLAGIITVPLIYLDYLYFFSGGAKGLGDYQMIPIYIVLVSIAAMLGAVAAAATALPEDASLIGDPRT